ncbi:MAG: hypothetical protein OEZ11_05245, partial [Gammaproteobacteria bacterium]|nr:hypothetical protein [Gammaproteobacteria bacterium]
RYRDPVFATVVVWAAYGISVMQSAILPVSGAASMLALLMAMLVAMELAARAIESIKKRNRNGERGIPRARGRAQ